ncbi:hypothetical protein [Alicyclobacillus macrosporangiidus]|uniref:Mce-associated membrane protein n=1 Tax=Alicyclobacillus macrosporangiidus TaxID=392015 RepID=A0A1I7HHI9_9BACL|nr:hypothetical protein [Alicyclobacillus macrosporangiidus]SFU60133.1 hypothetical protein SAMN05421543_104196 [Alicyclobacillus macrosporangiidus]
MKHAAKIAVGAASLVVAVTVAAMSTWIYGASQDSKIVTTLATEAVVFDIAQCSPFRMMEVQSPSDLKVTHVPDLDEVPAGKPLKKAVSALSSHLDPLQAAEMMNDTIRTEHQSKVQRIASQLFTEDGSYMQWEKQNLPKIIAYDDTPTSFQLDGGVDTLQWSSINVDDLHGTAVVTGQGVPWASFVDMGSDGSVARTTTPHTLVNFTVTLKKVNGTWKVDTLQRQFAPGYEP